MLYPWLIRANRIGGAKAKKGKQPVPWRIPAAVVWLSLPWALFAYPGFTGYHLQSISDWVQVVFHLLKGTFWQVDHALRQKLRDVPPLREILWQKNSPR